MRVSWWCYTNRRPISSSKRAAKSIGSLVLKFSISVKVKLSLSKFECFNRQCALDLHSHKHSDNSQLSSR